MAKQNKYIAQLEKLLTHLKNAKLEYLKAADHANTSEEKRFLNQQALNRNRFFQDTLSELQSLGMSYDDLIVSGFNFNQMLISSIETLNASAIEKCLTVDLDLSKIYQKIIEFEFDTSKFEKHIETIEECIESRSNLINKFTVERNLDYI
jgi:hypothetical protein